MQSITSSSSLRNYQDFVGRTYGPSNRRHFSVDEMLVNIGRFSMRGLKGIRKGDTKKVSENLIISLSWCTSLMDQLGVDIEQSVWNRFPNVCSYCGESPCACKAKKVQKRLHIKPDETRRPSTIGGLQKMFDMIYPSSRRTIEQAGIHLAEEVGELSEAVLRFRGHHRDADFDQIVLEASDLFSCYMAVFNSLPLDYHTELVKAFSDGCHACRKSPCECPYDYVLNFKS